jgi:AraC family transcriptional regulator of adaptative response / DNA-3-methyladenine glycosylase II
LLLAKRLLTDTRLPITDVALASGFGSLRRFNALFRARYRMTPSAVRRGSPVSPAADHFVFELAYRPPFDWDGLAGFLGARSIAGVDAVEAGVYRRTLRLDTPGGPCSGWLSVAHDPARHALRLVVGAPLAGALPVVLARVRRAFDLACDPLPVAAALGDLAAGRPGLRLPGAFDAFEIAVRAVLGQQISVRAARTLATRFVLAFGEPVETPFPGTDRLFPSPAAIAALSVEDIAALGVIGARARTIVALARALASGELLLAPGECVERCLDRLRVLPGVGEWTAQYVAMRALAWPDAFPHTDAGVMRALGESNPRRVLALAEAWRPWRGYAVMHLWRSLEAQA